VRVGALFPAMVRRAVKIIKYGWKAIGWWAMVLGVAYAPADTLSILETYPPLKTATAMVDRQMLLYAMLIIAGLWITWIDARPYVRERIRRHKKSSFLIFNEPYCESAVIRSQNDHIDTEFIANTFYLVVGNNLGTGATIKNVRANIYHFGLPITAAIKDNSECYSDLRHGEFILFKMGSVVLNKHIGKFDINRIIEDENILAAYKHNIPKGYINFEIDSYLNRRVTSLGFLPDHPHVWNVNVVISADDVKSRAASINIDMSDIKSIVTIDKLISLQ
jgi:hypothetical protein